MKESGGVYMWVNQSKFAKLLQENETRVVWNSDKASECYIVHEWRLIEGGRCLLREYQRVDGSMYWVDESKLEG
jgi:hypothetical protein